MKYTKECIYLKEGEIEIWDGQTLIGTTDIFLHKHVGSIQLDRKAFVKPVDVVKLANSAADELYHPVSEYNQHFFRGWCAGYNANANEFTREQLIEAVKYGAAYKDTHGLGDLGLLEAWEDFIDSIRPLSIPESVTIENNQVIEVKW